MKKFISVFLATTMCHLFFTHLSAQSAKDLSFNSVSSKKSFPLKTQTLLTGATDVNAISARAIRHFNKNFKGASEMQWSIFSDGFLSRFVLDGNVNRVYYDKKGNWLFTVKYYDEAKLPKDERVIVKSKYYDYNILTVQEIQLADKTIYLVDIDSKDSRKKIRVCDGEMETINDFQNL